MLITSIILGIISLAGFIVWAYGLKKTIADKNIRFKKVDREEYSDPHFSFAHRFFKRDFIRKRKRL